MSRGLRNCNPGNIRKSRVKYEGEVAPSRDTEFKEFRSMAYGYRAMFVLLDSYRSKYGLCTIRQMLGRYAPPTENFTEGYVRFVSSRTGIAPDEIVNTRAARDMIPIVAAMSQIENGVPAIISDIEEGWSLFSKV
ncbi:MAG: structural protein P5 [Alistipes sp.]|nr:structural protein P5 [Alistipes sp.]